MVCEACIVERKTSIPNELTFFAMPREEPRASHVRWRSHRSSRPSVDANESLVVAYYVFRFDVARLVLGIAGIDVALGLAFFYFLRREPAPVDP